jgi:16S rRNA (guanine966-N2)-methyltransferase
MRVIAGRAKGRPLKGPRDVSGRTRPTSGLVRGAVFSALASLGTDLGRVLDLYAGSGAMGIEALSRGAGWCDFVERDPAACALIRENLAATGFDPIARVHRMPAERSLGRLKGPYSLVLADPPYGDSGAAKLLESLARSALVEPGRTVIVVEHSAREEPRARLGEFSLVNSRRHGDSAVSIYR